MRDSSLNTGEIISLSQRVKDRLWTRPWVLIHIPSMGHGSFHLEGSADSAFHICVVLITAVMLTPANCNVGPLSLSSSLLWKGEAGKSSRWTTAHLVGNEENLSNWILRPSLLSFFYSRLTSYWIKIPTHPLTFKSLGSPHHFSPHSFALSP